MNYLTEDGEVINGASPMAIVTALRDGSRFASNQPIDEFMRGMAERYYEWNKSVIRADTEANFVEDITRAGFLTEMA